MLHFCIAAHQDPTHFGRLVRTLALLDSRFYVHIDAKVDQRAFEREVRWLNDRCRFIERRSRVAWGGFSQVRYQLELLRAASADLRTDDRVFLLSGADYPICAADELLRRISSQGDLLRAAPISRRPDTPAADRFRLFHARDVNLGCATLNRAAIGLARESSRVAAALRDRRLIVDGEEWEIYVGSSYMCLTGGAVQSLLHTFETQPQVLRYFHHGFVPEEMVIPTVIFNSSRKRDLTVVTDSLDLIDLAATHHFSYGKIVKYLHGEDLNDLLSSGKLFGRKFRTGVSERVLDYLDRVWAGAAARQA